MVNTNIPSEEFSLDNFSTSPLVEALKKVLIDKDEIFIIGHDNIDVDAALSGILLSRLLDSWNIKNRFVILEPVVENETFRIVKNLTGIDLSSYESIGEDSNRNLILVDHYETTHAGNVIACIDHHMTSKKLNYELVYQQSSTATAFIIYMMLNYTEYKLTAEEAKMIVVAMMVDTVAFKSSKTVEFEAQVAKGIICPHYNLDYKYLEEECFCLTPIDQMSIQEIVTNGLKSYDFNGHKVEASYVQINHSPHANFLIKCFGKLKKRIAKNSLEMFVFLIFDLTEQTTYECRVYPNSKPFDIEAHNGILSRGKDIMPKIEALFKEA